MLDQQKHKNAAKYQRIYRRKHLETIRATQHRTYLKHGYKRRIYSRDWAKERRIAVLKYYSKGTMACNCCSEKIYEFLALDHIDHRYGTGKDHRKKAGSDIVAWILKNGFPDGFQVLCHNCNMAKGLYRLNECPHKTLYA